MKLALFDLDSTLLPIDSDHGWGEFTCTLGWVDGAEFKQQNDMFYRQYKEQALDIDAYIDFATAAIRAQGVKAALQAREQFMQEVITPHIHPQAQALVNKHQDLGYECILVTATNSFVTDPIAAAFGFKHLIATDLEYGADGELTGRVAGVPSFQGGKVVRVAEWMKARGQSWQALKDSTCFSDSMNDLPMLEKVKVPVATNPDNKLEALAKERGWKILRLFA